MSKPIESDALDRIYRMLGLSGGALPSGTLLDDGNVSQVLDINPIVRRSRTSAATTGWFACTLENAHAGAGDLTSSINPYEPGDAAIAPYPSSVPAGFDFWILYAILRRSAGGGDLTGGLLSIAPGNAQRGWGIDDMGAAVIATDQMQLAIFTSLNIAIGSGVLGLTPTGEVLAPVNMRVPVGNAGLFFRSEAAAAATFRMFLICGLFPEGLGQDVAQ